jgi:SAM-dependent methyltransferase
VEVVCDAAEVRAQLEWLEGFHLRRLKPGPSGRPPRAALEDRADFTQGFATNVVACTGCGLIFRDPRPSRSAIEATYARDQYGAARLEALFQSQHDLYRRKARVLRRWLPAGQGVCIVEVGSFVGGFLMAGRSEGWDVRGIDPGEEVARFCRARGLPVFRGTLEEMRLRPRSVDCVAVWNTFDQLPEPATTLDAIQRVLRPGGVLALRIPNGLFFRRAVSRLRRWPAPLTNALRAVLAWNNLLGFPYLHGYTVATVDRLLARYDLAPLLVEADTLVQLSDAATRPWAVLEERVLKLACRTAWSVRPRRDRARAPWLDLYFRRRDRRE